MKRSNRLVLLVGVFLAIVAFVGVLLLMTNNDPGEGPETVPTTAPTVIATADIPLGTRIAADQVTTEIKDLEGRDADAFGDPSQVIGQIVRQPVTAGQAITQRTLTGGTPGAILNIETPPGQRSIAVQVDQVTGVGTVIKTGDYVDMIVGLTAAQFPVITVNPDDDSFTVVSGLNGTSVKLLLQGMQVLGTLLPPPPAQDPNAPQPSGGPSTTLSGQQEIVILSVTPQQAEIIKFAQMDGNVSLILRSPEDFIDPTTGEPYPDGPVPDTTTGVILKTLVDSYGVLPPELVETVLPSQEQP